MADDARPDEKEDLLTAHIAYEKAELPPTPTSPVTVTSAKDPAQRAEETRRANGLKAFGHSGRPSSYFVAFSSR